MHMTQSTASITIRPAYADDSAALLRLAALDSAEEAPPMPLLVAGVDGELQAALSLRDGSVIADPFRPTLHLLALLRTRAASAAAPVDGRRLRRRPRLLAA
jgi:hypothetical protein